MVELSKQDINCIRHWFNLINENRPFFLTDEDRKLYCRILSKDDKVTDTRSAEGEFFLEVSSKNRELTAAA